VGAVKYSGCMISRSLDCQCGLGKEQVNISENFRFVSLCDTVFEFRNQLHHIERGCCIMIAVTGVLFIYELWMLKWYNVSHLPRPVLDNVPVQRLADVLYSVTLNFYCKTVAECGWVYMLAMFVGETFCVSKILFPGWW
jgi:hypothetical protein